MSALVSLSLKVAPDTVDSLRGLVALRLREDPCATMRAEVERLVQKEVKRVERKTGEPLRRAKKIKTGRRPGRRAK